VSRRARFTAAALVGAACLCSASGNPVVVDTQFTPKIRVYHGLRINAGSIFKPYFYVDKAALWPSHEIEVCWEQGGFLGEHAWVQSAVARNIEKNSDFRFGASWPTCDGDSRPRIRISVFDTTVAPESEVGYQSHNGSATPTHMRMNFTFQNWNQLCAATENARERCIETIAVHEFLHAIGTLHEQIRNDYAQLDPACWALYENSQDIHGSSPFALTDYDPKSIMNFCRDIYSSPTKLSVLDLVGLKALSLISGHG
jgi:hypothetical protein